MPFIGASVKLHLVALLLVVDLAEDQFQQFPERLRFLKSLVARDVVVTATESEQQGIRSSWLELVEPRTVFLFVVAPELRNIRDFLDDDLTGLDDAGGSKSALRCSSTSRRRRSDTPPCSCAAGRRHLFWPRP